MLPHTNIGGEINGLHTLWQVATPPHTNIGGCSEGCMYMLTDCDIKPYRY